MGNKLLPGLVAFVIWTLVPVVSCSSGIAPQNPTNRPITPAGLDQTLQPPETSPLEATPDISTLPPLIPKAAGSKPFPGTVILGNPTDNSVTLSLLTASDARVYLEYGRTPGNYSFHTDISSLRKDVPQEIEIVDLDRDAQYHYRILYQNSVESAFWTGNESTFHTQRAAGETFSFGVQGDSHPDRPGKMFDPDLYLQTMNNARDRNPDFYFTMGDDFSIEHLIDKNQLDQGSVNQVYSSQRDFLGIVGSSSPLFLVNGNHEQAARYLLTGTANNAAVFAGKARTQYYPLPAPGNFYSGDTEPVQNIGLLKDYYAWTWGDALFVVIDPYWHSPVPVDNVAGGGDKHRNMWDITLGDAQYEWLERTLANSGARYKFIFAHHVLGTGRGGIEMAGLYEWGGQNQKGIREFDKMRPGWNMPVHELMSKYDVTIFFQGHDHLFCRQQLDGVVYQTVPNPADPTYQAFNGNAYQSGDLFLIQDFLASPYQLTGSRLTISDPIYSKTKMWVSKTGKLPFPILYRSDEFVCRGMMTNAASVFKQHFRLFRHISSKGLYPQPFIDAFSTGHFQSARG